jgi:serine phosphatase RsbU (regulator of sigma subunit)
MVNSILKFFLQHPQRTIDETTYRQARLIVICALITALFDVFYIGISLLANFPQGVLALSITFTSYIVNAFLFRTSISNNVLGNLYCAIFYMIIIVLGYYTGAIRNHSIILPWLTVVPAIALLLVNRFSAWVWLVLCMIGFAGLSFLKKEDTPIFYNMDYDAVVTVLLYSGLGLIALIINSVFEANKSMALLALEEAHHNIKEQHAELDKQNKKIVSSINYSKRIQEAILPTSQKVKQIIPESFILFKPRDIVSGDFYWIEKQGSKCFIAAVDCTGHGVPGAFMSLIGNNLLREIVNAGVTSPELILERLHEGVNRVLQQHRTQNADGMDVSLCVFDLKSSILEFAGAKNPLILINEDSDGRFILSKLKGDPQCIGGFPKNKKAFTRHVIPIEGRTACYIFSDGGKSNTKFMLRRMEEMFSSVYHLEPELQKHAIDSTLTEWMLGKNQIDDILVVGFVLDPTTKRKSVPSWPGREEFHTL